MNPKCPECLIKHVHNYMTLRSEWDPSAVSATGVVTGTNRYEWECPSCRHRRPATLAPQPSSTDPAIMQLQIEVEITDPERWLNGELDRVRA
jgi:hypothetical protein